MTRPIPDFWRSEPVHRDQASRESLWPVRPDCSDQPPRDEGSIVAPAQVDAALSLLKSRAGLAPPAYKRAIVRRFLLERMRARHLLRAADYLCELQSPADDSEWKAFVSAFTINHTAFFRENHHFDVLAKFARAADAGLTVWSCAASTGEEAYSIAITLCEAGVSGSVLATDIDARAIAAARLGIYDLKSLSEIPPVLCKRYFLRGSGSRAQSARIKPKLAAQVEFGIMNLCAPQWPAGPLFDAVFCRNVMIYFDQATQTDVLRQLARRVKPGGLLFVGHSENFSRLTHDFELLGQTVYRRNTP
ncbi:MAG: chemotaxis protein CheR [Candidimonas sp.]|nr:MAG: chemotaxis protein CheR [Candidimonas sp.]